MSKDLDELRVCLVIWRRDNNLPFIACGMATSKSRELGCTQLGASLFTQGWLCGFCRFFAPAWIVAEICQFKPLYRSKTAPTIGVQSVLGRFPRRKGLYFGIFVMVFGVAGSEAGRTLTRGWI